jgi:hypothetical protein
MKVVDREELVVQITSGELVIQPTHTQRDRFVFDAMLEGMELLTGYEGRMEAEQDFLSRLYAASVALPQQAPERGTLQNENETADADFKLSRAEARLAIDAIHRRAAYRTHARYKIDDPLYGEDDETGRIADAAVWRLHRYAVGAMKRW